THLCLLILDLIRRVLGTSNPASSRLELFEASSIHRMTGGSFDIARWPMPPRWQLVHRNRGRPKRDEEAAQGLALGHLGVGEPHLAWSRRCASANIQRCPSSSSARYCRWSRFDSMPVRILAPAFFARAG